MSEDRLNRKKYPHGYENGRIISRGMTSVVFIARRPFMVPLKPIVCIKAVFFKQMHEKRLFRWVKSELKILHSLVGLEGCIQLLDVFTDKQTETLKLVFPYFWRGDLASYIKTQRHGRTPAEMERMVQPIFIKIVKAL